MTSARVFNVVRLVQKYSSKEILFDESSVTVDEDDMDIIRRLKGLKTLRATPVGNGKIKLT